MPGLSNAVENKILDHLMGGPAYSPASPLALAITSVAVTESDTASTITKISYTGYADHTLPYSEWAAASGGGKATNTVIDFPQNTGATSPTAVGFAILNGADVVLYGTVPTTVISPNITPEFASGALSITAD
jgi:hypothetical protein